MCLCRSHREVASEAVRGHIKSLNWGHRVQLRDKLVFDVSSSLILLLTLIYMPAMLSESGIGFLLSVCRFVCLCLSVEKLKYHWIKIHVCIYVIVHNRSTWLNFDLAHRFLLLHDTVYLFCFQCIDDVAFCRLRLMAYAAVPSKSEINIELGLVLLI